jgi:membrane dipeptidase
MENAMERTRRVTKVQSGASSNRRHSGFPAPITRRTLLAGVAGTAAALMAGCAARESGSVATSEKPSDPPQVFDMHGDTIDRLGMNSHAPYTTFDNKYTGDLASSNAQLSADRMGNARWAQCYAIWIPDNEGDEKGDIPAIDWYREAVAWFQGQMEQHSDRFAQARHFSDIPSILDQGKIAAVLTVENAACLDAGIEVVDEFAKDGVLIAGMTWNFKNVLGAGNQYPEEGLTDLGKEYVAALEAHDIVVDVSHLNDVGFWELDQIATKPYIATHSNARAVCNHARNLTDDQFKAMMARGGLVGLNCNDAFVREGGYAYTFDELCTHVEHWLDLGGEDLIALGMDRDGSDIPTWLADCTSQPYLFERFSERLGEELARKLFFQNAMDFFGKVG